jgi:hypothetical protein
MCCVVLKMLLLRMIPATSRAPPHERPQPERLRWVRVGRDAAAAVPAVLRVGPALAAAADVVWVAL